MSGGWGLLGKVKKYDPVSGGVWGLVNSLISAMDIFYSICASPPPPRPPPKEKKKKKVRVPAKVSLARVFKNKNDLLLMSNSLFL
jgi:hypothetical protein